MPRVPIYNRDVNERGLSISTNLQASPRAFGAASARAREVSARIQQDMSNAMRQESQAMYRSADAMIRAGQTKANAVTNAAQAQSNAVQSINAVVNNFIKQRQAKEDESDLLAWELKLSTYNIQLEQEGGALTRKGKLAVGITNEVEAAFDKMLEEMPNNPAIKARAERLWMQARERSIISASRIELDEKDKMIAAQRAAAKQATINAFALAEPNEDGFIEAVDLHDFQENVATHGANEAENYYGADWNSNKEAKKFATDTANEAMSEGLKKNISNQLAKGDPIKAKKVFDNYRHLMTPEHQLELEALVKDAADMHQARRIGEEVGRGDKSFEQKTEALKSYHEKGLMTDDQYDEAYEIMRDNHYDQERIREDNRDEIIDDVNTRMSNTEADKPPLTVEEIKAVGPTTAKEYEKMRLRVNAGHPELTTPEVDNELENMTDEELADMGSEQFNNKYFNSLNQEDYQKHLNRVKRAVKNKRERQLWTNADDPNYELTEEDKEILGPNQQRWKQQQVNEDPVHPVDSDPYYSNLLREKIKDGSIADMTFTEYTDLFLGKLKETQYEQGLDARVFGKQDKSKQVDFNNTIPAGMKSVIDSHIRKVTDLDPFESLNSMNEQEREDYAKTRDRLRNKILDYQSRTQEKIDEETLNKLMLEDDLQTFDVEGERFWNRDKTNQRLEDIELLSDIPRMRRSDLSEEQLDFYTKEAAEHGKTLTREQAERVYAWNTALTYDIPNASPLDQMKLERMVYNYFKTIGYDDNEKLWIKTNAPWAWDKLEQEAEGSADASQD